HYEYLRDTAGLIHTYTQNPVSGSVSGTFLQQGQLGDDIAVLGCDCNGVTPDATHATLADDTPLSCSGQTEFLSENDNTQTITTTYSYTRYPGSRRVQERITTLPAIPVVQNGSGVANTRRDYYDLFGHVTWHMNERGFITRTT